jgi:SAM-dependent methyltransferase
MTLAVAPTTSDGPSAAGPTVIDEMPLRHGTPAEFETVRQFFRENQFNDRTVCAALGIPDMGRVLTAHRATIDTAEVPAALLALIDLFVFGSAVPSADFRALSGERVFAALSALNLIRPAKHRDGAIVCPAWVYPVHDFVVASDRCLDPDGAADWPPADAVFPAHDSGTLKLLRLLPALRGGDTLDLCGGSGIIALHFSKSANRASTSDITARSAFMADFNSRLNGADVESACGDLYEPVSGRRFEVITAHPPWVPSVGDAVVFRDGGEFGEAIIQRIIEGVSRHLDSGGTAVIVAVGRDTAEATFENRVRGWLGPAGQDCDVILGVEKALAPENVFDSIRKQYFKDNPLDGDRLADRFRESGTDKFIYGALFIRRTDQPVTEPPLRVRMSSGAVAADFDRVFAWRSHRRSPGFDRYMQSAKPRLAPQVELNVRHVVKDGALVNGGAVLTVENALPAYLKTEAWTTPLFSAFDGEHAVAQIFERIRNTEQMPDVFTSAAFTDFVALLIERGFIEANVPPRRAD